MGIWSTNKEVRARITKRRYYFVPSKNKPFQLVEHCDRVYIYGNMVNKQGGESTNYEAMNLLHAPQGQIITIGQTS